MNASRVCEWHIFVGNCSDAEFQRNVAIISAAILFLFGTTALYGFVLRIRMHLGLASSPSLKPASNGPSPQASLPNLSNAVPLAVIEPSQPSRPTSNIMDVSQSQSSQQEQQTAHATPLPPVPRANNINSNNNINNKSRESTIPKAAILGPMPSKSRKSLWSSLSGIDHCLFFGMLFGYSRMVHQIVLFFNAFPNYVSTEVVWDIGYYFGLVCAWAVSFGVVQLAAALLQTLRLPSRVNSKPSLESLRGANSCIEFFRNFGRWRVRSETIHKFAGWWIGLVVPLSVFPLSISAGVIRDAGNEAVAHGFATGRFVAWTVHAIIMCAAVDMYGFRLIRLLQETAEGLPDQDGEWNKRLVDIIRKGKIFLFVINGTFLSFALIGTLAASIRDIVYPIPEVSRALHIIVDILMQITNWISITWVAYMVKTNSLSGFANPMTGSRVPTETPQSSSVKQKKSASSSQSASESNLSKANNNDAQV